MKGGQRVKISRSSPAENRIGVLWSRQPPARHALQSNCPNERRISRRELNRPDRGRDHDIENSSCKDASVYFRLDGGVRSTPYSRQLLAGPSTKKANAAFGGKGIVGILSALFDQDDDQGLLDDREGLVRRIPKAVLAAMVLATIPWTAAASVSDRIPGPDHRTQKQAGTVTPHGWVATWATSPEPPDADPDEPLLKIANQTIRERVRVSAGAMQIRLRLSNEYGATPLRLTAVTIALPDGPGGILPSSLRQVAFDGHRTATIAPHAQLVSDPIPFPLHAGSEISLSLYCPGKVRTPTWHALALKRAIVSTKGDHTGDLLIRGAISTASVFLNAVLVPAQPRQHLIVAFGDSLVDGDRSTVDADRNWPSVLTRRLRMAGRGQSAVLNEGIAGNRLLADGPVASLGASALSRFDRDALKLPGVTHILLLEGVNDLGFPGATLGRLVLADTAVAPSARDLIQAYRQMIARAHARGVKIIGGTLTPFEDVTVSGYWSPAKEARRQAVNRWIRTSGAFDGVIDFDRALRDPSHRSRIQPRFASPDGLHPNDAGYAAMAAAIDLSLLE